METWNGRNTRCVHTSTRLSCVPNPLLHPLSPSPPFPASPIPLPIPLDVHDACRPRGVVAADNNKFCEDFSFVPVPVPVPVPPCAAAAVEHGRGASFDAFIACSSRYTRRVFSGDFPFSVQTTLPSSSFCAQAPPRSALLAALDFTRRLYVAVPSAYTILRPTYAIHAAAPHFTHRLRALPEDRMPTGVYLRAPTNGYAHARAVRAFWDVGLDARAAGGSVLAECRCVRVCAWVGGEEMMAYEGGWRAGEAGRLEGGGRGGPHEFGISATRALRQGFRARRGSGWLP
ncbi:hypothetical protein B0H16DRAFT_1891496 [Mycena metata]|uniref:Uncharacterized protein n=1 Tax=Mycena metata TaxID=1033252 RepID=A0AAD7I9T0_9AGAR|nr:hypothetical protein B0H16DRAFT_1891496 [Mycena metata]